MIRLFTAAVLAPGLWLLIKKAPPVVFDLVAVGIVVIASWECYRMLESGGSRPLKWFGLASVLALTWSFAETWPHFDTAAPLAALGAGALVLAMWRRPTPKEMLASARDTAVPVLFIGLGLSYLVGLRGLPGEDGKDLLLLLFACVICSDTAAYYVGRKLGRHRMAPSVSPKKTWEGAAAGLAGSVGGALLAHFWFYQRLSMSHALALGLALGVAGMLGDLAASILKRASGVKDSSALLPGHGGVLDRTDSLLFAGPFLYYYYRAFLQVTP